jgi:hypothetical protein
MEVRNHPVLFSELNGAEGKGEKLTTPQPTTNQKSKDGVIASAPETIPLRVQQQRPALVCGEPVAQSHAYASYTFDSSDTGGKFGTEEAGIGCLVRHASDRSQAEVDRCRSKVPLLQVDSVSQHNRAIECQSRFRAVPVHELVDRMIVCSLTTFRGQAIQYGRLCLFEIR